MEESLSLLKKIKTEFMCEEVDLKTYSPLTLAFIGDCIYDLIIRTVVVERRNCAPERLHKQKSELVKAQTQAKMAESILEQLTEDELAIYKRGRNAKSYTSAKNASISDYRKATGFEALMGYLYLNDEVNRMIELIKEGLTKNDLTL